MKWVAMGALLSVGLVSPISAQTPASPTPSPSDAAPLEALVKKIDEQNAKIDALSQQILKLQQEIANKRPGVMIGETPEATSTSAPGETAERPVGANTHTVVRGETLTSIAKQYKVSIEDLQRVNHIEDGRRLQAGQTITIPSPPVQPPPPSPAPSP
ncbi:MAG TPA: LysM peptidoglycan-binding domain-containing protein [Chthoniobacterales bacterium]|nr:LysM peptidoglycan-binding domain-containing protein [Chthoniobacterales bacterium]